MSETALCSIWNAPSGDAWHFYLRANIKIHRSIKLPKLARKIAVNEDLHQDRSFVLSKGDYVVGNVTRVAGNRLTVYLMSASCAASETQRKGWVEERHFPALRIVDIPADIRSASSNCARVVPFRLRDMDDEWLDEETIELKHENSFDSFDQAYRIAEEISFKCEIAVQIVNGYSNSVEVVEPPDF